MSEESDQLSGGAIAVMLAYLAELKEYKGSFGESVAESGYLPYMKTDEIVDRFHHLVYEGGWVMCDYRWSEQGALLANDMHIAQASVDDIRKAFTYAVRSDRFCDGNLVKLFKAGVIKKLLKRLEGVHQS